MRRFPGLRRASKGVIPVGPLAPRPTPPETHVVGDFHLIWVDQCAAARGLKERFGVEKALGYLVGEKLLNYVEAAETHAEFRQELPRFVAEIQTVFEPGELRSYLDGVRRVGAPGHIMSDEDHALCRSAGMFEESVVRGAESVVRMGRIRELLLGARA